MIESEILLFRVERVLREKARDGYAITTIRIPFARCASNCSVTSDGLPFAESRKKRSRRRHWSRRHPRGSRNIRVALSDFLEALFVLRVGNFLTSWASCVDARHDALRNFEVSSSFSNWLSQERRH
jgi:hypothetical protein